ncbi:MAG: hypothetical protein ACYC38_14140 [Eubacteriales bacterium]
MGVLVGRIGRVEQGFLERYRNKLRNFTGSIIENFYDFAYNYGLTVAGREFELRKDAPGQKIINSFESYGVSACEAGAVFWKK